MLTIESASGWTWDDAAKTLLRATVKFAELPEEVPYTFTAAEWPDDWSGLAANPSIAPYQPPPVSIPEEVTRRQAKIALSRAGILSAADAAIADMAGQLGEEARINWTDAAVFRRDHPLILGLGAALGLTSAQIDDLFVQAAAIT